MPNKMNMKKALAVAEKVIEIIRTMTDDAPAGNERPNNKVNRTIKPKKAKRK